MKYFTHIRRSVVVALFFSISLFAQEQSSGPSLKIGMDAVGVWQNLSQTNDPDTLKEITSGFQAALGNLHFTSTLTEGIDVYFELYLSSKAHAGYVMDREGYVRISKLPEQMNVLGINSALKYVNLKAGHFEVDFGNTHLVRSDNAQVQKNPLVGNYVVDPNTVEFGVELIGGYRSLHALAGIGSGLTVEDFQSGRQYSKHGKVWIEPEDRSYNVATSLYRVNQAGNPPGYPFTGSYSEMFAGNRSGSRYSGVIEGGAEAGQIKLGKGQDLTAWQFDGAYVISPVTVSATFGGGHDLDLNGNAAGSPSERWTYYGAETKYDLIPEMVYVAGRYSKVQLSDYRGSSTDASVDRLQVGLGLWVSDYMLFKTEYVNQNYRDFKAPYPANPRFSGVLAEMSMSF